MQKEIIYHQQLPIIIIRSKQRKKTISLKVLHKDIHIYIPYRYPETHLKQFIESKITWIQKKVQEQDNIEIVSVKQYQQGESFLYLGDSYQLKIHEHEQTNSTTITNNNIVITTKQQKSIKESNPTQSQVIKKKIIEWYKKEAYKVLIQKTHKYAEQMGIQYASIHIKNYRARWGSCTFDHHISYNWKLIMSPHFVIDYVVVHELCHIIEHNHSQKFWRHVKDVFPDYEKSKEWLKENTPKLNSIK